jgi:hypothetical protein
MMIQFINNYYSFVIAAGKTIIQYTMKVASAAVGQGGDAASLNEITRAGTTQLMGMVTDGAGLSAQKQDAGMTDMQ